MRKLLGRVLGTDKAIDNILDKEKGLLVRAGGWVNDLGFTDQEREKAKAEVRQWGLKQLEALEPFKVVQRILAFGVISLWGFLGVNVVVAIWIEAYNQELNLVGPMLAFAMSDYVFWPAVAVLSLYMTGGVLPALRKDKK